MSYVAGRPVRRTIRRGRERRHGRPPPGLRLPWPPRPFRAPAHGCSPATRTTTLPTASAAVSPTAGWTATAPGRDEDRRRPPDGRRPRPLDRLLRVGARAARRGAPGRARRAERRRRGPARPVRAAGRALGARLLRALPLRAAAPRAGRPRPLA